ncbi:MAG: hypothetical protein R2844_10585 [Caldilineales bacterium]
MYPIVLSLHSIVRWAVVILGVIAVVRAFIGWFGGRQWQQLDDRLGLGFTTALDINLLLGLLLYFFLSPITTGAFKDFGAAMGNSSVRFFAVEHIFIMIVAVVLAHIGRSRSRKAADDKGKFKRAAIFFGLAMLAVIAAIPWPFMSQWASRGWL